MKFLTLALASALFAAHAFAADGDVKLLERTYKIRIQAGWVECRDGIPPNGHNFPVYTALTFTLPSYDLWLSDVWTNVSEYRLDGTYEKCSSFAKLLRPAPGQDLVGTVTQVITENSHLSGDKKTCMRETREEATLVVDGATLRGVSTFLVGPIDPKNCR